MGPAGSADRQRPRCGAGLRERCVPGRRRRRDRRAKRRRGRLQRGRRVRVRAHGQGLVRRDQVRGERPGDERPFRSRRPSVRRRPLGRSPRPPCGLRLRLRSGAEHVRRVGQLDGSGRPHANRGLPEPRGERLHPASRPCSGDSRSLLLRAPNRRRTPFGNGFLCVGAPRTRSGILSSTGDSAEWAPDFSIPPHDQIDVGSTWYFQYWFRDPSAGR